MSALKEIWAVIQEPADQLDDWYGWASNQLAHAMMGAILGGISLFFANNLHCFVVVGVIALFKEILDLTFSTKLRVFRDGLQDIIFQLLGCAVAFALFNVSWVMFAVAVVGGGALLFYGVKKRLP